MSTFFKKLGGDINKGFKKVGGALKATFKKGGYVDKGLSKVGDVAKQVGKYAGQAGRVLGEIAPTLAVIPGVGPELAAGALAAGELSGKIGGAAGRVGAGVRKAQDIKNDTVKRVGQAIKGGPMPVAQLEKPAPEEDMIGLANPAFDFVG